MSVEEHVRETDFAYAYNDEKNWIDKTGEAAATTDNNNNL
jgi:hypothetical protein